MYKTNAWGKVEVFNPVNKRVCPLPDLPGDQTRD